MKLRPHLPLASLITLTLVVSAATAAEQPSAATRRPNVLWLIAEDIGTDLGCYGDRDARTPNLDKLAAQGRRYQQAHSTAPVCSPSRSAFITGVYQTSFGAQNHRSHRGDGYRLPSGVELVTDRLRKAGYFTANVVQFSAPMTLRGRGKTDWNFQPAGQPFDSAKWEDLKGHQPFYAQVNFGETHRVYERAKKNPTDPAKVTLPPYLPDHPVARADWAAYHDSIHELDAKVGEVLELLEKEGLSENTLIFFFGDHGRECFRGKYYAYEQGTLTSLLVRWPGRVPAGSASDELVSLIDVTATTLSLAGVPVPEGMHGQPFLGPKAKRRAYLFTARDRIDETLDHVRTVRDDRYKYIRNYQPNQPYLQHMVYAEHTNPNVNLMKQLYAEGKLNAAQAKFMAATRPTEELYDLRTDPFELKNLAQSPESKEVLARLRSVLDKWRADTNDQGLKPEDPATLRQILQKHKLQMKKLFGVEE